MSALSPAVELAWQVAATEAALPRFSGNIFVTVCVLSDGGISSFLTTVSTARSALGVPAAITAFVRSSAETAKTASCPAVPPSLGRIWAAISLSFARTSGAAACCSGKTWTTCSVCWSICSAIFWISGNISFGQVTNSILLESSPVMVTCCRVPREAFLDPKI